MEGRLSIEELRNALYLQKTCGRPFVYRSPESKTFRLIEGLWRVLACGGYSVYRRPVKGLQFIDGLGDLKAIVPTENLWKVFYLQKTYGRYWDYKRHVKGLRFIEYLWRLYRGPGKGLQ